MPSAPNNSQAKGAHSGLTQQTALTDPIRGAHTHSVAPPLTRARPAGVSPLLLRPRGIGLQCEVVADPPKLTHHVVSVQSRQGRAEAEGRVVCSFLQAHTHTCTHMCHTGTQRHVLAHTCSKMLQCLNVFSTSSSVCCGPASGPDDCWGPPAPPWW